MRAYYCAVPLVFWLFGPHFMILATLVTVAIFFISIALQTKGPAVSVAPAWRSRHYKKGLKGNLRLVNQHGYRHCLFAYICDWM